MLFQLTIVSILCIRKFAPEDASSASVADASSASAAEPVIAEGGKEIPSRGKTIPNFLPLEDVIKIMLNVDRENVPEYVPCGVKENKYFVVQNGANLKRRDQGLPARFWDDCGAWASGGPSSKYHYLYAHDQKVSKIVLKDSVYCWGLQQNRKTLYSLDSQAS